MSTLLFDRENEESVIVKKTTILNKDATQEPALHELEKTIHKSVSDFPLGKALNLLVNIHGHIFDKAVQIVRDSTPTELTMKVIEMPTVRAIVSIENYLSASNDITESFKHVYNSLHEKFIKRSSKSNSNSEPGMRVIGYFIMHSKYQKEIQQHLCNELRSDDKRSQLAAVLLLQFVFTQYISPSKGFWEVSTVFVSPLVYISNKYSESPTLLACSSCDLALNLTRYTVLHMDDPPAQPISNAKIMELDDTIDNENSYQTFTSVLDQVKTLFHVMEKWQKPAGQLEAESYKILQLFVLHTQEYFSAANYPKNERKILIDGWDLVITHLTPKSILSRKPLSMKNQKAILLFKADTNQHIPSLMPALKIVLITLLQQNRLVELYGNTSATVILTAEEEEIKKLFVAQYNLMIASYPMYKEMSKQLIIQLITNLPQLCKTTEIDSEELIQTIIDHVDYDNTKVWLVSLCMKQPESSVCNLLLHVIHQDTMSQSCYELLGDIIAKDNADVNQIIERNLLSVIKCSNQACELLIQCMSYTDLSSLIQKLMAMTDVDNERERMTCIALIAKALLHQSWADYSILLYLDMIRDIKLQKGFVVSVEGDSNSLTPASIIVDKKQRKPLKIYSEQELADICAQLMAAFQLWSTKVEGDMLKSGLKQLVRKSYGLPNDSTCIDVWRYLSFAFLNDHSLIWDVITECLHIMTSQSINLESKQDVSQDEIFLILSPLLILHVNIAV
ncbi:unnamed protein product [Mucor hiemalis]